MVRRTKPRKKRRVDGKHAGGRPSLLSEEVTRLICAAVVQGNFLDTAAQVAGVSREVVFHWMKKGREEKANGKHAKFLHAVQVAMAKSEQVQVAVITRAASQGVWQAAAHNLKARFPHWRDRGGLAEHEQKILEMKAEREQLAIEKDRLALEIERIKLDLLQQGRLVEGVARPVLLLPSETDE